jgi:hypothetical protein
MTMLFARRQVLATSAAALFAPRWIKNTKRRG